MEAHTLSIKLFIHVSLLPFHNNKIFASMHDLSVEYPDDYVLLEVRTISLDINAPTSIDIVSKHVAQLQSKKERIGASASMQIAALDDKIQQLLCIEHSPEDVHHIPF